MAIPMPQEVEMVFYHTIGGIIVRYGYIDALVASVCKVLFEQLGGHSSQKKAVRPMGVRLEYIGKCYRNKPELDVLKGLAAIVCQQIDEVDLYRTFIVHGCMTEYLPEGPAFQFTKVDPKEGGDGYEQASITLSEDQLLQLAQVCTEIVRNLQSLGEHTAQVAALRKGEQKG